MSKGAVNLNKKLDTLLSELENISAITWFDIGLFFDKIRENRVLSNSPSLTEKNILTHLQKGIAFLTFNYGIDGVTIEIAKYARALERLIIDRTGKEPNLFWLAQEIKDESKSIIKSRWRTFVIEEAGGFVDWDGYEECFKTKIARGSPAYNSLIEKIWAQTKVLVEKIGTFVVNKNIQLLFPVNICSNPGNIPYTLSIILLSEYLNIPVFNSNHDFYWEDGAPQWERGDSKGFRDHFFTNADIGEVFSFLENYFPWSSPLWFQVVLNKAQQFHLINHFGFCPAQVAVIPTAVDTNKYCPATESTHYDILYRLQLLFSGTPGNKTTRAAEEFKKLSPQWLKDPTPLFLGNRKGIPYDFQRKNILLLQPTRLLGRKRIEFNFILIEKLLGYQDFERLFESFPELTITLLITGPVTTEHYPYVNLVVQAYRDMLKKIKKNYRDRIFLALRFGIEANQLFHRKMLNPLDIHEIFAVADLVTLPSQQEGRGLPIIESAASGVPIFASRYYPEEVFSEVIGEHLDAESRISLIEFPANAEFDERHLQTLTNLFSDPHYFEEELEHNIEVVKKRFSHDALKESFDKNIKRLAHNIKRDASITDPVHHAFATFAKNTRYGKSFNQLTLSKNRVYLPGVTKLEHMVLLKSLIDPSFFRMEEKNLFGRIFQFASKTITRALKVIDISIKERLNLYRQLEYLFEYYKGAHEMIVDHSLSYRHRHTKKYPYRGLTECELRGVVAMLIREVLPDNYYLPPRKSTFKSLFKGLDDSAKSLVGKHRIGIDHSSILEKHLKKKRPLAWFPGDTFIMEATIFVEWTLLVRLGFAFKDVVSEEDLESIDPNVIGPVTLFIRKKYFGGYNPCRKYVLDWLKTKASKNIQLFYKKKLFKIVATDGLSDGTHLGQLGPTAEKALFTIKDQDGFVVSASTNNLLTSDLLDIPQFHIGVANNPLLANFLGIPEGEGFILWVPAGVRPSIAYPTPLQSPQKFSQILSSDLFKEACSLHGQKKVLALMREDADTYGTPLEEFLQTLIEKKGKGGKSDQKAVVRSNHIVGCQPDGSPWSGAYAIITADKKGMQRNKVHFTSVTAKTSTDSVFSIIKQFKRGNVSVAWNGGYILNPELVGKLGLSEDYIGSPLGLLVCEGKVLSLPLFNKPALAFSSDGSPSIREANLHQGLSIGLTRKKPLQFLQHQRNNPGEPISFFDLLYEKDTIPAEDRIIYRFSGNKIIEVIENKEGTVPLLPVGITVSIQKGLEPVGWKKNCTVVFNLPGWEDTTNAIEAGPRLMRNGATAIEMEAGGWNRPASIKTQAARIDYMHMRGPKIGVGISNSKELIIVAVNGRLRESVGATHGELASILADLGAQEAMGFDPGGSVTLVVNNRQLNISPYNKNYLHNPYALPPEPRFIGNAILGYQKSG